jgi:hypothetical protein
MILIRWWKAQQLCNSVGASLMDRGANCHLDGLQIQLTGLAPVGEDALELLL